MGEKILIISERKRDQLLFEETLGPKNFEIESIPLSGVEDLIFKDVYDAILADYDLVRDRTDNWLALLQELRSRSCFILYGKRGNAGNISEMLQKGAYAFIPRPVLGERVYDTILGGLENRKAFIEILGMMDDLRVVNKRLRREKEALRTKNHESGFINQLSSEVAYDLNWDRILPRILETGILGVVDLKLFSILYRIGSTWNIALYLSEEKISRGTLDRLKEEMVNRFFSVSKEKIPIKETLLHLYPSNTKISSSTPVTFSNQLTLPLSLGGRVLGMMVVLPKDNVRFNKGTQELMSTITNILAMSLKNAQEYHRLKELAVTDGLTGIYNHKGFNEFLKREVQRAKRYHKPLSLIMIDVDNFKTINDTLGHQAGDYVLRELASCLKGAVRNTDIVARYGGDEFVIILPETEIKKAEGLTKRMIRSTKRHVFGWGPETIKVNITQGISSLSEIDKEKGEEELVRVADSRLYEAKQTRDPMYPMLKRA